MWYGKLLLRGKDVQPGGAACALKDGHSTESRTVHHTREIATEHIRDAFLKRSNKAKSENKETMSRRTLLERMERPIGIEPTPEPWQGSVLPLY